MAKVQFMSNLCLEIWKTQVIRDFNKSFIEVARKQAKSQMEAGVILYEMSTNR
ncbi:hypothetical protein [Clostridium sp. Marseille-Q7071]